MKGKFSVLVCVILITFLFVSCLPEWLTPVEDEEDDLVVMEANVEAVLVMLEEGQPNQIAWSIENTGDLFIREYKIIFNVLYLMETKDNVLFEVTGKYLEVKEKREGIIDLVAYDNPETVSVEWELFD